jgi:hypothetical protein
MASAQTIPVDAQFAVIHRTAGPDEFLTSVNGCGFIAFYLTHRYEVGEVLGSQIVIWPDGRHPQDDDGAGTDGEIIVCAQCGQSVGWSDIFAAEPIER